MIGTIDFDADHSGSTTLYLHRVVRLADLLELHLLLSFWANDARTEQFISGWVLQSFERAPTLPLEDGKQIRMRLSEEDPRVVWKMMSNAPLRLSLAYIATVSAVNRG